MLGLGWALVLVLIEGAWYEAWDVCVQGSFLIAPLKLDSNIELTFPIYYDFIVFPESLE